MGLQTLTDDAIAPKADETRTMSETVCGIATIKLFGRRGERLRLWQNRRADAINADLRLQRMTIWFELLGEGVTRIETVLFVFLAVSMVIAGGFTVGMIFAFLAYKGQFLDAGLRFADLVADWKTLDTPVARIADIALEPPDDE